MSVCAEWSAPFSDVLRSISAHTKRMQCVSDKQMAHTQLEHIGLHEIHHRLGLPLMCSSSVAAVCADNSVCVCVVAKHIAITQ